MANTLAILRRGEQDASSAPGVFGKLRRHMRDRRAPRDPDYMRRLASDALGPDCEVALLDDTVDVATQLRRHAIERRERVVLLWADATGYGWGGIERAVMTSAAPRATLHVLNGRRRFFELDRGVLRGMRARRVLERFWLGEVFFGTALLVTAPFVVVWDLLRGRT